MKREDEVFIRIDVESELLVKAVCDSMVLRNCLRNVICTQV